MLVINNFLRKNFETLIPVPHTCAGGHLEVALVHIIFLMSQSEIHSSGSEFSFKRTSLPRIISWFTKELNQSVLKTAKNFKWNLPPQLSQGQYIGIL